VKILIIPVFAHDSVINHSCLC